ncbi:MAG: DNA gyrase inhibitor YacG [Pseudomonadota bacterium]
MSDRTGSPPGIPPLRVVRTAARCPVCGKDVEARYRPFCSKRCADVDLGRWLKEGYRVETDEPPSDEEAGGGSSGPAGQRR